MFKHAGNDVYITAGKGRMEDKRDYSAIHP